MGPTTLRYFSSLRTSQGVWVPSSAVVIGAGQMGVGIALSLAEAQSRMNGSCYVTVLDSMTSTMMAQRKIDIKRGLKKWFSHDVLATRQTELQDLVDRMDFRQLPPKSEDINWDDRVIKNADFLIEAIVEDLSVKSDLFNLISSIGTSAQVIASNTSSISITKLSKSMTSELQERAVGMHFFNPVPRMPIVEMIPGLLTSDETKEKTRNLGQYMGKEVCESRDFPGFISNRILMPYINEAILAYQEGVGTQEDIDKIMKFGTNVPMGPLQLADFIGLDTCLHILGVLKKGVDGARFHPAPLLVQYVDAGRLGRKSGAGFYEYNVKK